MGNNVGMGNNVVMGNNVSALGDVLLDIKKKKQPTVVFVLDGSSSISAEQFQVMRDVISAASEKIGVGSIGSSLVKAGIIQFGSEARDEVALTVDSLNFQKLLLSICQMRTSTNTADGIKSAIRFFSTCGQSDGKYMFLLTDGKSNNRMDTIEAAQKLKTIENVTSVCIGIGSVDPVEISAIASNGYAIYLTRFSELAEGIRKIGSATKAPQISVVKRNFDKITIKVIFDEKIVRYETQYMIMEGNAGWVDSTETINELIVIPKLPPRTKLKIRVRAVVAGLHIKSDYSNELVTETRAKDTRIAEINDSYMTPLRVKEQILSMKPTYTEIPKYNFLFVGQIGAGKSSIINTLQAALSIASTAHAFSSTDHVTNSLEEHDLTQNIQLYDIWGWTSENKLEYRNILTRILDGVADSGFKMTENVEVLLQKYMSLQPIHPMRKIHAVAVVVDINTFTMEDKVEQMKMCYNTLSSAKLFPLFIINKVDLIDYKVKDDDDQLVGLFDSDPVAHYLEQFHEITKIPIDNVLPTVCYTSDVRKQDPYKSRLALLILRMMFNRAEGYAANLIRAYKRPLVADGQGSTSSSPVNANVPTQSVSRKFEVVGYDFKLLITIPTSMETLTDLLATKIKEKQKGLQNITIEEICDSDGFEVDYGVLTSDESKKKVFNVKIKSNSVNCVKVSFNRVQKQIPKEGSLSKFIQACKKEFTCEKISTILTDDGCEICDDISFAESDCEEYICK